MLAGSQTMSAAIGSAEEAINAGVVTLPAGMTKEQATSMIALSYGITYIWGTVGIILITKYLPSWWGIDAKAAARQYEEEHGVGQRRRAGLDRLDARCVCAPIGWRTRPGSARPSATLLPQPIPNTASSTSCAAASR